MKKFVSLALCLLFFGFFLTSCGDRGEKTQNYSKPVVFSDALSTLLPTKTSYAEKRGFGDFNNDGIEDMIEIKDTVAWGQKYQIRVFYGFYKEGILNFKNEVVVIDLPITLPWFSSGTKFDIGDVNGDGYCDVILTEYHLGFVEDSIYVAFAINQKGKNFLFQSENFSFDNGNTLGDAIMMFIEAMEGENVETLSDYLKMDWGDADGNGSDDLQLFWDGRNDLSVEIMYTENTEGGRVRFSGEADDFYIPEFMFGRRIMEIDVEDFNGDGKSDIFLHKKIGGKNSISIAFNNGEGYTPHKDFVAEDVDMSFFKFEKYDTFDVDGDGKADFVHLGEVKKVKTMAYNLNLSRK